MFPKLLVLSGPPCSGKSSLSAAIATKTGFCWLETDRILSTLIPHSDRRKSHRNLAYRVTLLIADELLNCGHSVLLDATYGSYKHRKAVEDCAKHAGVPLFLVQCNVSPEVAVGRFRARGAHPARDLTECRVRQLASRYRFCPLGVTLTTEMTLTEMITIVQSYIEKDEPVRLDGSWSVVARGYSS